MAITYPSELPLALKNGNSYQVESPLVRSSLANGRAIQRRRFTDVPEYRSANWLLNSVQTRIFESWFRDALKDGAEWLEMPLLTPEGLQTYEVRFVDVYDGPSLIGPDLWNVTAKLEMRSRAALESGWGAFPEFVAYSDIIDLALNQQWPIEPWQTYGDAGDLALNQQWPTG